MKARTRTQASRWRFSQVPAPLKQLLGSTDCSKQWWQYSCWFCDSYGASSFSHEQALWSHSDLSLNPDPVTEQASFSKPQFPHLQKWSNEIASLPLFKLQTKLLNNIFCILVWHILIHLILPTILWCSRYYYFHFCFINEERFCPREVKQFASDQR